MVQVRPHLPSGHGELLTRPDVSDWPTLVEKNRAAAETWDFRVAGLPASEVRSLARAEVLDSAWGFSSKLGVEVASAGRPDDAIVMTGHQPELYHPGVWIKDFLLQRTAGESGASAVDLVVDTDGFDSVALTTPCMLPEVRRCSHYLAVAAPDSCYACSPMPSASDIDAFCKSGDETLAGLQAPALRHHFARFCSALHSAHHDAETLAELVTIARRRYESDAGSDYLELPVTGLVRTRAFRLFVADIVEQSERFTSDYNAELQAYRAFTKTRSAAQPFPDLSVAEDGARELPLWLLVGGVRRALWCSCQPGRVELRTHAGFVAVGADASAAVAAAYDAGALIAPKALALTLFARVFTCDLFIHGVGGGRYDRVTDGVCRRYYGVEPPAFAVASLTMYLPLGAHVVTEEELATARERLNRLAHNPNEVLGEVEFESPGERDAASRLAGEKAELVAAIGQPGADRKSLGMRIKEINSELGALLAPLKTQWDEELASLESQRAASEVFTDRTYPFCLWSPQEVADKAR